MEETRWEVTIVDQDSEDFEKDDITQYEARVTAMGPDEAKQRALTMIRACVVDVSSHKLVVTNVREIWNSRHPPL